MCSPSPIMVKNSQVGRKTLNKQTNNNKQIMSMQAFFRGYNAHYYTSKPYDEWKYVLYYDLLDYVIYHLKKWKGILKFVAYLYAIFIQKKGGGQTISKQIYSICMNNFFFPTFWLLKCVLEQDHINQHFIFSTSEILVLSQHQKY